MNIQVIQHVEFEGPGAIGDWTIRHGHEFCCTRLFDSEPLPHPDEFDWLILMGGPMSIHDENQFDWLVPEKRWIEQVLSSGKRILGICLGAQLLASVLGARVDRSKHREIGWFPVNVVPGGSSSSHITSVLPQEFEAFHWHGETFDLPQGAVHLAQSAGCPNQAFLYGSRAVGIQFHLEVTPESVASLMWHCHEDIGNGPFEQNGRDLAGRPEQFPSLHGILDSFLDAMARE